MKSPMRCSQGPTRLDASLHIETETKCPPLCRQHSICILLSTNCRTLSKISTKFVPKGPVNKKQALVRIMTWCPITEVSTSAPFAKVISLRLFSNVVIYYIVIIFMIDASICVILAIDILSLSLSLSLSLLQCAHALVSMGLLPDT